ncbi:MAG: nicotinate-nucleotide--dimethylbenzimidazole phosphoribosyltransferase [Lachnospiraceae bacterium]
MEKSLRQSNFKRNRIKPVIHGDLALGEGTGAVMVFSLLDLAMSVYTVIQIFLTSEMAPYERLS